MSKNTKSQIPNTKKHPTPNRTFEVLVTGWRTLVVSAKNEEEAMEAASDEVGFLSDWETDEYKVERELKSREEIERAVRHGAKCI